jgi:dTDP-4-dehydrorhamnose reductase
VTRILVIGSRGQVGWELQRALCPLGEVMAVDRQQMDLASPQAIRNEMRTVAPQIVVNAAAYTAVDRAESEPGLAMTINGEAPALLAEEARRLGAFLVHYSTDYVFDGLKNEPYSELDPPNPLSAYGRSKLAGEQAIQSAGAPHYIFRTSWVYSARGQNFLRTILRLVREKTELRIVDDQVGAPTWARALAGITARVLQQGVSARGVNLDHFQEKSGLYHVTAAGAVSWFGFADAIVAEARAMVGRKTAALVPVPTSGYPLPARRPANSRLDNAKFSAAFGLTLPRWDTMLSLCLRELADDPTLLTASAK